MIVAPTATTALHISSQDNLILMPLTNDERLLKDKHPSCLRYARKFSNFLIPSRSLIMLSVCVCRFFFCVNSCHADYASVCALKGKYHFMPTHTQYFISLSLSSSLRYSGTTTTGASERANK
jgi:hypothetical protein